MQYLYLMQINRTKKLLQEGRVALGCSVSLSRSAEIPRMYAAAGLDWIFIDTEHGPFTVETIQDLVRSCSMTTITPIVRVADFQYSLVARALDMGAEGIIFPRVDSAEVLAKAISWTKFPPQGVRGCGFTPAIVNYAKASVTEITAHLNEQTLVIFQIESKAAVERCDELVSVPGVDAVMIGPADLSISYGVGGQFEHPDVIGAIETVIEACNRHGRSPSIQTRDPEMAKFWIDRGMKLVGCGNDLMLLWNATSQLTKELHAARGD